MVGHDFFHFAFYITLIIYYNDAKWSADHSNAVKEKLTSHTHNA
jgi:hypothetical protein